ncbi:MAG TPA: MucR family transcriptional regulator [Allosphingosinicella sp.]|jgi:predicted transcriptional regulator
MEATDLITLTSDIVASHVSNNRVSPSDMPDLIQRVHQALAGLSQQQAAPEEEKKTPLVSVRASVKPDYIVCMECGRKQKTLRRHLMSAHGMTPDQYRKDYGLPDAYPLTAPNYSERRREMAKSIGLGRIRSDRAKAAAGAAGGSEGGSAKGRRGKAGGAKGKAGETGAAPARRGRRKAARPEA